MKIIAALLFLSGCVSQAYAQTQTRSQTTAKTETLTLECRIQYKKDGELSHRTVALHYDQHKLISVHIDLQPVYSFTALGRHIVTSVDSERIKIEFATGKTVWRSNFRDRDFGDGLCVMVKPS